MNRSAPISQGSAIDGDGDKAAARNQAIRRGLDGAFWSFLSDALMLATGLFAVVFLTRRLGADGYGQFVLISTFVGWIGWSISALCPARTVIKLVGSEVDPVPVASLVMRLFIVFGLLFGGAVVLLSGQLSNLFGDDRLTPLFALGALEIFVFSLSQAQRNLLIGIGRFRLQAFGNGARWLIRLLAMILLIEAGFGVMGAIMGGVIGLLAQTLIYRNRLAIPIVKARPFPLRTLFLTAVPFTLFALSIQFIGKVDLLAVKLLGGTIQDTGIYGAAHSLAAVPLVLAGGIAGMLQTTVNRLRREGHEDAGHQLCRDVVRLCLALFPFAAACAASSPEVVALIFGAEYGQSADVLAVLMFTPVATIAVWVATVVPVVAGRPGMTSWLAAIWLAALLIALALTIPDYGMIGAAWSATGTSMLAALGAIALAQVYGKAAPGWLSCIRIPAICLTVYIVGITYPLYGLLVVAKLAGLALLGIALLFITGEIARKDVRRFMTELREHRR